MTKQALNNKLPQLETSPMWKKTVALAEQARAFALTIPYQENYSFADPIYRNSVMLTSDIAMAVGKGDEAAAFDYRYARGHLFTVKSLVLMADKYGFAKNAKPLLREMDQFQQMIDAEIRKLDAASEAPKNSAKVQKDKG